MWKLLLLGVVLICAAVGIFGVRNRRQVAPKTVIEMDALIKKRIPIGSSRLDVVKFLDSEHIEHSDYILVDKNDLDDELKQKADLINGVIYAAVRDVQQDESAKWGLFVRFYFDDKESLVDYRIKKSGIPFNT
jgi:hypothetical protein